MLNIFVVVVVDLILWSNMFTVGLLFCVQMHMYMYKIEGFHGIIWSPSQCVYTSFFLHLHSLRYQIIIRVLHHWFCFISLISTTISMLFFSKVHCPHNCFGHCLCWKIRVLSFTYDATLILSTVYRDSQ